MLTYRACRFWLLLLSVSFLFVVVAAIKVDRGLLCQKLQKRRAKAIEAGSTSGYRRSDALVTSAPEVVALKEELPMVSSEA